MLTAYRNHLLAANRSTRTTRTYLSHLNQLARQHSLNTVTADDLERYLADRHATHQPESRKSMRTAFRSFYGWAHDTGLLEHNPAEHLAPIRIPATVPRVAPDDAVQHALATAEQHTRVMIMLARYGCLRLTELATLHPRQRQGDLLRIIGKGSKERLVPLNLPLMQELLALERSQGRNTYYFPGRFGGSVHPQSANKLITRQLGMNPHSLRHAGATAAYQATNDLRAVQMLLGHSSMATTQRYLHIGLDAVRAAAAGTLLPLEPRQRADLTPPAAA